MGSRCAILIWSKPDTAPATVNARLVAHESDTSLNSRAPPLIFTMSRRATSVEIYVVIWGDSPNIFFRFPSLIP